MSSATRILAVAILAFVVGCGDDPLAPFEPEVSNATDSFQLQATGVTGVTRTLEYTWTNTGTLANVNHSTTATRGTGRLIIRAPNGTQVYSRDLVPSLNEQTTAAVAGAWTLRVVLTGFSGTLNFRVQKP